MYYLVTRLTTKGIKMKKRITIIIDVTSDPEIKDKLLKKANGDSRTLGDYLRLKLKALADK